MKLGLIVLALKFWEMETNILVVTRMANFIVKAPAILPTGPHILVISGLK